MQRFFKCFLMPFTFGGVWWAKKGENYTKELYDFWVS